MRWLVILKPQPRKAHWRRYVEGMAVSSSAQGFDVIVTAGDRQGSRPVLGTSKAFLPVAGAPIITHVLHAVERARCSARIFVIGDVAQLEQALGHPHSPWQGHCPLVLLEQSHTLYENVWNAFLHTLPGYAPGSRWQDYQGTEAVDKAVLVMPGDIPLATPNEIDTFVDSSDLALYDYCMGFSTESVLRAYYPQPGRVGIRMAYFTLRDLQVRQNNLHLVKPLRFGNRHYVQQVYEYRYQREWGNILKMCWELSRTQRGSWRVLGHFLCLHLARLSRHFGWHQTILTRPVFLEMPVVCSLLSQVLQTRFTAVLTPYGGCALDVDNAEHYAAICANFHDWIAYQHDLAKELKPQD